MAAPSLPAFRGRTSERETLARLLESARGGRSAVVVLRGEAGVGKTALVRHVAGQAAGFRLAEVAGVEAEQELPFAGLHQLCAPLLDGLGALPGHQGEALCVALGLAAGEAPDRLLVSLAALGLVSAAAEGAPLLCLVDDVQWLDRATRQVLGFVARRLLAEPVAVVFGLREPGPGGGGTDAEPELAGLPELRLEGLGDDDARALLAAVVAGPLDERVRDRIVAETRGNPLALLELPRSTSTAGLGGGFALPGTGALPRRLEEAYVGRLAAFPDDTRRLLLLAAADPVGDATLLWRAARALGIDPAAATPAAEDGLLEIGGRVRFRHPLVRSAVYRAGSDADRRAVHAALEAATDPETDPDRRTWHRAHAASAPDDAVADLLVDRAASARSRGGIAAMAAFLRCATALTGDPALQATRALDAARATFAAGDADAAESLLAAADAGPLDELSRAEVAHLRGQVAFDLRRGRDAPRALLAAARRLERLDAERARETHLEALVAAVYAARLADDGDVAAVAAAARAAAPDPASAAPRGLLLAGLATRLADGAAAGAPALAAALRALRTEEPRPDWSSLPAVLAAQDLMDGDAWRDVAARQADLARATGSLSLLPYALDHLAGHHLHAGDLAAAEGLWAEASGLAPRSRAETLPYIPLQLAAWRGQAERVVALARTTTAGALARGEGCALTVVDYAAAVLHNGRGEYELALGPAERACAGNEVGTSSWALPELVEAAVRAGREEVAVAAADRLAARARAAGTDWARGAAARARALVTAGEAAGDLHAEAVEALGRSGMAAHLARARLAHGEWLRRAGRRLEAREVLRAAHEAFEAMGATAFADRARSELLATGEKVRRRRDDTRAGLTSQELRIARLARDGKTNPEIGAMLFLSARTVEWHLRKVFDTLGISSRRGLPGALAAWDGPGRGGAPATRTA